MSDQVSADQLFEHLQAVIRDSEALLKATAAYAGDKVEQARAQAEDSLRAAKARLADVGDDMLGRASDLVNSGDDYVRENPWRSVGVAAVIGFLLGALVARSSRSHD